MTPDNEKKEKESKTRPPIITEPKKSTLAVAASGVSVGDDQPSHGYEYGTKNDTISPPPPARCQWQIGLALLRKGLRPTAAIVLVKRSLSRQEPGISRSVPAFQAMQSGDEYSR